MSLESVKHYFLKHNMDNRIELVENSTATVEEAAHEHGVNADQIGKTLAFKLDQKAILIVVSGNTRIDNAKYKDQFLVKPTMLKPDEVLAQTGHKIGGVCPFGLANDLTVYLDRSLQKHQQVLPAAGNSHSAIKLTIEELEKHSNFSAWVDVGKISPN